MLVKMGVSYGDEVQRPIRRIWGIVDSVFMKHHGREAVLSSTTEGDHQPNSLHYAGLAADFRIKYLDLENRDDLKLLIKEALRERYGDRQYDVLFSPNKGAPDACLHIEYDPK